MTRARARHLNPSGLHQNPAFSQVVTVEGPVRTIYVGGQNAIDASGEVVGGADIGAQAEQVLRNLESALEAADATLGHVIKWQVNVIEGQPLEPGFGAFVRAWGDRGDPPLITLAHVAGLAHPDILLELDAVAVVPLDRVGGRPGTTMINRPLTREPHPPTASPAPRRR